MTGSVSAVSAISLSVPAQAFLVYGCRNLRLSVTAHCADDIVHALERIAGAAYFIGVLADWMPSTLFSTLSTGIS